MFLAHIHTQFSLHNAYVNKILRCTYYICILYLYTQHIIIPMYVCNMLQIRLLRVLSVIEHIMREVFGSKACGAIWEKGRLSYLSILDVIIVIVCLRNMCIMVGVHGAWQDRKILCSADCKILRRHFVGGKWLYFILRFII